MSLIELSTSEWIAIIGIVLAFIIGVIQIGKKRDKKDSDININQKSGSLSKSDQTMSINIGKHDDG